MDFDEIYKIYSPKIYRVCLGYFNDSDIAKDFTQETFISVWENLHQFENRSTIGTWIFRIATNKCLQAVNLEKKHQKTKLPQNLKEEDSISEKEEQLAKLHQYISELPEVERIIMGLYLEGLPQEKIAEITGISNVNLRVKIHRIKEKLSQKLKENGQF